MSLSLLAGCIYTINPFLLSVVLLPFWIKNNQKTTIINIINFPKIIYAFHEKDPKQKYLQILFLEVILFSLIFFTNSFFVKSKDLFTFFEITQQIINLFLSIDNLNISTHKICSFNYFFHLFRIYFIPFIFFFPFLNYDFLFYMLLSSIKYYIDFI